VSAVKGRLADFCGFVGFQCGNGALFCAVVAQSTSVLVADDVEGLAFVEVTERCVGVASSHVT
jgi:hypothetical protein